MEMSEFTMYDEKDFEQRGNILQQFTKKILELVEQQQNANRRLERLENLLQNSGERFELPENRTNGNLLQQLSEKVELLENRINANQNFENFEHLLQNLNERLELIENERKAKPVKAKGCKSFGLELVQQISSIVGLKEIVESDKTHMKFTWTSLVVVGIASTAIVLAKTTYEFLQNPTATQVDIVQHDHFPPIVFCTPKWFDVGKAKKLGLSVEATMYALHYLYDFAIISSEARSEFLDTYSRHNFSNLVNFYTNISTDFEKDDDDISNLASTYETQETFDVDEKPPKKMFMHGQICYVFEFSIPRNIRNYPLRPRVYINVADKTGGIMETGGLWYVSFSTHSYDYDLSDALKVDEFTFSAIKISSKKLLNIDTSKRPCQVDEKYERDECLAMCESELAAETIGCILVYKATQDQLREPINKFCNYADGYNNMSLADAMLEIESKTNLHRFEVCSERCPTSCTRMFYEASIPIQKPLMIKDEFLYQNVSTTRFLFYLSDGMMLITEVRTYTLTSLVTAVGGTLGLFVGCTAMTLVQIIIFCMSYACRTIRGHNQE